MSNTVTQLNGSRSYRRQYGDLASNDDVSLGTEIRRHIAWITLGAREIEADEFEAGFRNIEEALSWLMTISLEVDALEDGAASERRTPRGQSNLDAAAEE
jgi:hypothetical protein